MISRLQNSFNHSLFVKCLDHFQFLLIVNNVAMTFLVIDSHLYLWLILQARYLGVELLDQRVRTLWSFLLNILADFLMHIITWTSSIPQASIFYSFCRGLLSPKIISCAGGNKSHLVVIRWTLFSWTLAVLPILHSPS